MKKYKYIIATLFIVAIGAGIFLACEKDTIKSDVLQNGKLVDTKNHKSMGNHQQPTSNINTSTVINILSEDYTIFGSAEVGDYDGRIYEYDATWSIHLADTNEDLILHLTITLKPEYEDLLMEVYPLIENYIITVNENNADTDFVLTENNIEIITYATIVEFWTNVIAECNQNITINELGAEALALSRETGINIFELADKSYFSEYMTYIYYMYNTYSDDSGLIIEDSVFYTMLDSGSEILFLSFNNGIQNDFPTFFTLDENMQDSVLEVTEEVLCYSVSPKPPLKGMGWFNLRRNFAEWQLNHNLITPSEYRNKISNALYKLWLKNGDDVWNFFDRSLMD
jgi:hypothetical protein